MTNLNELQIFFHVAETGSFTEAAKRLDLPKSTVSRGLSRLETRLGIRLMERTTRRLLLTEAGEVYLEYCRKVMSEVEQGEIAVSAMRGTPRGRLRVGAPILFSRSCLTPLVPEFLQRYPDVQLHLLLGEDDSNLLESGLDFQIHTGRVPDSEMFVRCLGHVLYGLYASPSYLATRGFPATPDELFAHDCVTCQESGPFANWILRHGSEKVEIRPLPRFSAIDSIILKQLAIAGIGIANIPRWVAEPYVRDGQLVRLLPEWEPEAVEVSAVYPSPLKLAANARVFLEFLVERLCFDIPTEREISRNGAVVIH